jgi:hypothetical protein
MISSLPQVYLPYVGSNVARRASDSAACPSRCVSVSKRRAASATVIPPACTPRAQASRVTRTRASSHTPTAKRGSSLRNPSSTQSSSA